MNPQNINSMKKLYTLFLFLIIPGIYHAQQLPFDNQYLVNKFSLSPAYAGYSGDVDVFATYRQNWIKVQGAPEKKLLAIQGKVDENMGLGGYIISEQTGIFKHLNASLAYAYYLELDRRSGINFGLAAGFYNNRIDISSIHSEDQLDPTLISYQDYHGTTFDAQFGALYYYENLNIGVTVPRLLGTKITYEKDNPLSYSLKQHFMLHASYLIEANREWTVEPFLIARTTINSPFSFDLAVQACYTEKIWGSIMYRQGNTFGISIGGALINDFVANYTYEFGGNGIQGISGGTHEFTIGYRLKYKQQENEQLSAFPPGMPEDKQMELELDKMKRENDKNERKIKNLQVEIENLKKQLQDCCDDKKDVEPTEIKHLKERIKTMETTIEELRLKQSNIEYKDPFTLKNIYFATNSDELKPASFTELDKLVKNLKENPSKTIKITGHTDNIGDEDYNLELSKRRALAVKRYLVSQSISPSRILTEGLGETQPKASNESERGRAMNRRIEVRFSKNGNNNK